MTCSYTTDVGTSSVDDIPLSFRVTDSAGRTADWSGVIAEGAVAGTFIEYLPVAVTQSSVQGGHTATLSNIRDVNVSPSTGAQTFNTTDEWVRVDLGSAKELTTIYFGTGTLGGSSTGSWLGHGFLVQHSPDGVSWTSVSDTYLHMTTTDSPPTDYAVHFSPASARYWRIKATQSIRTATLRTWGYVGGIVPATTTITQSSVFGGLTGSFANLGEIPNNTTTGAATNNGALEWIKADLGSIKQVRRVVLSGGTLPGWGGAAAYLNGGLCYIQTSLDNVTWDSARIVTGVIFDTAPMEHAFDVSAAARYVRLSRPGYLSTTAFRVYTLP